MMLSPNQISIPTLTRMIGTPNCPILIDVRIPEDVASDPTLLPGALQHPFSDIETLVPELTGKSVIIYCQKGKKLSQGSAALLRHQGIDALSLSGGHLAWQDAGHPLVRLNAIPERNGRGQTVWVTRERPKIDRIACPWLIRRFVDPGAVFLFVPAQDVKDVADRFKATAFDIEDTFWSHRGELCSFDTMIAEFGLQDPALLSLADIIRGADTARLDLTPQSAGLLAVSLGLSQMHDDDLKQLDAAMPVYDAFYRWLRDAGDETHNWPAKQKIQG